MVVCRRSRRWYQSTCMTVVSSRTAWRPRVLAATVRTRRLSSVTFSPATHNCVSLADRSILPGELLTHAVSSLHNSSCSTSTSYCSVNRFPKLQGSRVPPLPPLSSSSPLPPSFSITLRSRPLNPARGLGKRCKPSRQRFWCILRAKERCWWHSTCTVSINRKRLFLTFL